jgi:excisionase family DNA binding protein
MSERQPAAEPPQDPRPAPLLDAREAGRLLNVPPTWVLAEARANRIPHVRLGRYVRFDAAELSEWWHTRARGPWRSNGIGGRLRSEAH